MTKIISISNEKGGVAKTTSTAAIGSVLSRLGYKVILVDLDPQADLTVALDIEPEDRNIFDCIFSHRRIKASKVNDNLVLVGGDARLTPLDFAEGLKRDKLLQFENPRLVLRSLLELAEGKTDFILLDCPPNREIITQNALAASDYVLIPTEAHSFSVNGIANIIEFIEAFQQKLNPKLDLLGIFITRYRNNTSIHLDMKEWLHENFRKHMFSHVINENITLQEATQMGRELENHDAIRKQTQVVKTQTPFRGLQDYKDLVEELLEKIEK